MIAEAGSRAVFSAGDVYPAACAAFLGLASLNVLMLQRLWLWRISVATTEYGHWLALPTAGLVIAGGSSWRAALDSAPGSASPWRERRSFFS